jgi:NDP-sugar pyrophosphorylase family protein
MDLPPIAVLAGGLATRMRPLTEKVPKSLLEVAGEPFIAHQLRLFRAQGAGRVVICTGYLGTMIEDFVGDGARFGLEVAYSYDGETLLGTGGALKRALPLLGGAFMVVYGDSWLDTDYGAVVQAFRASRKPALMTVFRNENAWDTSNVVFDGDVIRVYDKRKRTPAMQFIDWGMGMLESEVFDGWDGAFDLADVYSALVAKDQLAGYEVKNRFYEIGSKAGLEETGRLLQKP